MAAGAAVQLAEYLLADSKRRQVRPLIGRLRVAAAAFFRGQASYVLRSGLPYLAEKWPNVPRLAELATLGAVSSYQNPKFAERFARLMRQAYDAGIAEAETALGVKLEPEPFTIRNVKSAELLREQIDSTSVVALEAVLVAARDRGDSLATLRRAVKLLFRQWTRDRAPLIAGYEVSTAYHRGLLDAADSIELTEGLREARAVIHKYWAIQPSACPRCEENEAEGDIPLKRPFPSGADAPPAHPNCMCSLVLIDVGKGKPAKPATKATVMRARPKARPKPKKKPVPKPKKKARRRARSRQR